MHAWRLRVVESLMCGGRVEVRFRAPAPEEYRTIHSVLALEHLDVPLHLMRKIEKVTTRFEERRVWPMTEPRIEMPAHERIAESSGAKLSGRSGSSTPCQPGRRVRVCRHDVPGAKHQSVEHVWS